MSVSKRSDFERRRCSTWSFERIITNFQYQRVPKRKRTKTFLSADCRSLVESLIDAPHGCKEHSKQIFSSQIIDSIFLRKSIPIQRGLCSRKAVDRPGSIISETGIPTVLSKLVNPISIYVFHFLPVSSVDVLPSKRLVLHGLCCVYCFQGVGLGRGWSV